MMVLVLNWMIVECAMAMAVHAQVVPMSMPVIMIRLPLSMMAAVMLSSIRLSGVVHIRIQPLP